MEVADDRAHDRRDSARLRMLVASAALLLVGLTLVAVGPKDTPLPFLGLYAVLALVPAALLVTYRVGRWAIVAALLVGCAVVLGGFVHRAGEDVDPFFNRHDGGVVMTEAAADDVLHLRNPYATDHSEVLTPGFDDLAVIGLDRPNPLIHHFPYLPAAFLAQVPLEALGALYDARILYVGVTTLALWVVSRGSSSTWGRAAAVIAIVASWPVYAMLPWGANDTAAASFVVIAALTARRRPWLAGVLLAIGVSLKLLLVVAIVPIAFAWFRRSPRAARESLLAAAATLVVTCVPFFAASPSAFVDDTVLYNLGLSRDSFPTSGLGLGSTMSGLLPGPLPVVVAGILVALTMATTLVWVRRHPEPEVALFAGGLILAAGLVPARTFQTAYLALLVVLWGPIWRLSAAESGLDRFSLARH